MAAFALPELLPNKWRHWAVVMADSLIYFDVIVGPVGKSKLRKSCHQSTAFSFQLSTTVDQDQLK